MNETFDIIFFAVVLGTTIALGVEIYDFCDSAFDFYAVGFVNDLILLYGAFNIGKRL